MRSLSFLLATAALAGSASAAEPNQLDHRHTFIYVSVAAEKRIAIYRMDRVTGKLAPRGDTKLDGEPGALTVDPQRQFLFASLRSTGQLTSFRINRATGMLTHRNTVPAGPDPAYLSTDATGRHLFAAYYVDAKVTVHAIARDGALGEKPLQSLPTADKAHAIVLDRSNRFVFVPHTGPDVIFQFAFDPGRGGLTAGSPAHLTTPKGTGPRHLQFHPARPIAYVANEQGSSVTVYALDTKSGTLRPLQTVSTLPGEFRGINACAEIKVHPSGKFLYVSNRGHDSIAAFAIDDGRVSVIGQEPTEKTPRSFDLDPTGKYLFAAGESSGKLVAYRVDGQSGRLKKQEVYEVGKSPWWVLAVGLSSPPDRSGEKPEGRVSGKPVKELFLPGESFLVEGRPAFVLLPPEKKRVKPQPWVLYAPTLPGLPDQHEKAMHERFLDAGVAVAGIDVGEAYGGTKGKELFTAFHQEMTARRGFAPRPCLLGRSRGGLWVTGWAADNPDKVAGLAGIYPVFDLRSYPGLAKAGPAYGLSAKELEARLGEFNPIERVGLLAKARVPALLIHGDEDKVVPLKENSAEFAARYNAERAEGLVKLIVAKRQGHNYWEGFFRCQELIDFTIAQAWAGKEAKGKEKE
ncbi:MAG TPA: beta-propeller fold lactonase family protein [Gemmataceae bacterium]|nr:beta-propeller fold lactonase family protein [Gemmataceae bacterium]